MNGRSETISVISVFVLLFMMGSVHAASVDLDGWTFAADLGDQWHSDLHATENADTAGWDSRSTDYLIEHNMDSEDPAYYNWKGVLLSNAFWLPQENANVNPQDLPSYPSKENGLLANVDIRVHKVPGEVQDWGTHNILMDLYGPVGKSNSVKDIEFNGRPALLVERDYEEDQVNDEGKVIVPASSIGSIEVLVADDMVVSIDVVTLPESDLSAWDVIEKFTISKK